jgi:C4-dicarboxylate-specific signal transduction histidine kinase
MMLRNHANAGERPGRPSINSDGDPTPVTAPAHPRCTVAPAQNETDLAHVARITSLGVLTASISHEVRQPLAAVIMAGQACLRHLTSLEPEIEDVRELTRCMIVYAQRAAEIIDRIHAMAARRAPQQSLLSLDDVIKESMVFLRHEFQSKGISVSLDLAPALPQVVGDGIQLQQVVVNLALNALQAVTHSKRRPGIFIRTMLSESEAVCCTIEDSGRGLDPEHMRFLFDHFFTTKGTDIGMGMGLPISRSIIEAHGGRIWADNKSALGGARFTFALPVNRSSGN